MRSETCRMLSRKEYSEHKLLAKFLKKILKVLSLPPREVNWVVLSQKLFRMSLQPQYMGVSHPRGCSCSEDRMAKIWSSQKLFPELCKLGVTSRWDSLFL